VRFPEGASVGHEGRGILADDLIENGWKQYIDPQQAVDQLIDIIGSAREPVTVLTIGPLTNFALALRARPDLAERISSHVAMGGVVFGEIHADRAATVTFRADAAPPRRWMSAHTAPAPADSTR